MNGCCCCLTDLMTMDGRVSQLLIHRDRIKSTSMNNLEFTQYNSKTSQPVGMSIKCAFFLKWRFKLPIWYLGSDNANANFDWLTLTCGLFGLVYNIMTPVLRLGYVQTISGLSKTYPALGWITTKTSLHRIWSCIYLNKWLIFMIKCR